MKFPAVLLSILAVACIALPNGDGRTLEQYQPSHVNRDSVVPFLIYVTEVPPALRRSFSIELPSDRAPEKRKNSRSRGITSVEIVKSIEVNVSDINGSNPGTISSDSGDLLFSDIDSTKRSSERSTQHITRDKKDNNRSRYRRIKSNFIPPTSSNRTNGSNSYKRSRGNKTEKSVAESTLRNATADGFDFNSRILIGNILTRKSKDELEVDKYSFYSEPKVSSNKQHVTYINHNATVVNKSRLNVKFPPKTLPIKNTTTVQNRSNKTYTINKQILPKNQTQKALYRSRFGKHNVRVVQKDMQDQDLEAINVNSSTEPVIVISSTQKGILQGKTHWDFGKKTPSTSNYISSAYQDNIVEFESTTNSIDTNTDYKSRPTALPHLVHPTRSTTLRPLEGTTPQTITENVIKQPIVQEVTVQNAVRNHQNTKFYTKGENIQRITISPTANSIKIPESYQDVYTERENDLRQNLGPHVFPSAVSAPEYSNEIRIGSFEGARRSQASQNYKKHRYRVNPSRPNVHNDVEQLEHQHGVRNNWQSLYFVPHVALQQPHFPAVVTLQTVDSRGAVKNIPVIIQHQKSRSTNVATPTLYQTAAPRQTENGIVYEGVLVAYPQDIQTDASDILPIFIS